MPSRAYVSLAHHLVAARRRDLLEPLAFAVATIVRLAILIARAEADRDLASARLAGCGRTPPAPLPGAAAPARSPGAVRGHRRACAVRLEGRATPIGGRRQARGQRPDRWPPSSRSRWRGPRFRAQRCARSSGARDRLDRLRAAAHRFRAAAAMGWLLSSARSSSRACPAPDVSNVVRRLR
jgi:hypothetical protein